MLQREGTNQSEYQEGFPKEGTFELRPEEWGQLDEDSNKKQSLEQKTLLQEKARFSEELKKLCRVSFKWEVE